MYDNYNYPAGADTPDAPWNQPSAEQSPIDIKVTISQTLHKSTTIGVTDYTATEWKDAEYDEEGHICRYGGVDYDFSDCNLNQAFDEQEWTIEEILNAIPEIYESLEKECCKEVSEKYLKRLKYVANACKGWYVDESEVIKD